MKKSEFKSYIKEEIFEILSEETAQDIEAKTKAQAELNKELEKTKESVIPSEADIDAGFEEMMGQFAENQNQIILTLTVMATKKSL